MIVDYLFAFGPFVIIFTIQMLCCIFVRHKLFRQTPLLISVFFLVMMVISSFLGGYDGGVFRSLYLSYLIESWIGYALAWIIYGVIVFFKQRKTTDKLE